MPLDLRLRVFLLALAISLFLILGWSSHSNTLSGALVVLSKRFLLQYTAQLPISVDVTTTHISQRDHIIASAHLSADEKWLSVDFGNDQPLYNLNIIPHSTKPGAWYMIAESIRPPGETLSGLHDSVVCEASYLDGMMRCVQPQTTLQAVMQETDRRYVIHGSTPQYGSIDLYNHDLQQLATSEHNAAIVEKNWFTFVDEEGDMYIHYDIIPRKIARIERDAATQDFVSSNTCLERNGPNVSDGTIEQATNSLSITMCERRDPDCQETLRNTYIMTIFHHRRQNGAYEPHIMIFDRVAPFNMFAISSRPFWINGREELPIEEAHLMQITSMNWMEQNTTDHGYVDDALFINFDYGEGRVGTIDVLIQDLFKDMRLCP